MRKYIPVAILGAVIVFSGCGAVKEAVKVIPGIVQEQVEEQGAPPPIGTTGTPLDYAPLASYVLNLILGTWAGYERKQRTKAAKS